MHKLAKFSSNPGKVHFEGLVHLLRYIRYNKTLGLKYYAYMNDASVTYLLIQASIKTENHLMAFYDYIWKKIPDNGRSTGSYIIFYQVGPIYHGTNVPGPVAQSIAERTCSSPRRPLFLHTLSFECTSKLCVTFLDQISVHFHI